MNQDNLTRKKLNTLVAQYFRNFTDKNFAFTLAEVLITLAIVGITAVLIIPNVVNGYKRKQLEIQFKKADSIIEQALMNTKTELGIDSYADMIKINRNDNVRLEAEFAEINKVFERQFKYVRKTNNLHTYNDGIRHESFWGNDAVYCNHLGNAPFYFLPDGMIISSVSYDTRTIDIIIGVDINGAKGPNRRGYDIFAYGSHWACDPLMQASDNLVGCWAFAHKNINPINKSVSYWESLYRQKSYWEKLRDNN